MPELLLGGGFKDFLFLPLFGEDFQFDEHIFQMGWFNHHLVLDTQVFGPGSVQEGVRPLEISETFFLGQIVVPSTSKHEAVTNKAWLLIYGVANCW